MTARTSPDHTHGSLATATQATAVGPGNSNGNPAFLGRVIQVRAGGVQAWGGAPEADGTTGRVWYSGIGTEPVTDAVLVDREGLPGDEQADRRYHGGPDKAVFVHPVEHYAAWRAELDLPEIGPGGFGENFVLAGCDETGICLGDVVRIGELEAQVSQPRRPCWKPAQRWGVKDLVVRIETTGRTGWYLRVRRPGRVAAGNVVELLDRPNPAWSVARTSRVMRNRRHDVESARELAAVPGIPERWRNDLAKISRSAEEEREAARVLPPSEDS